MSGGEQQRVAIARAMAGGPAIIFADEPTGNLDTATGHAIIELIFARRAALGATLLIITHDPELAEHCDRVVVMHDGKIEGRGGGKALQFGRNQGKWKCPRTQRCPEDGKAAGKGRRGTDGEDRGGGGTIKKNKKT